MGEVAGNLQVSGGAGTTVRTSWFPEDPERLGLDTRPFSL